MLMPAFASVPTKREYYEKDYQRAWCGDRSGQQEFVLSDKARVDYQVLFQRNHLTLCNFSMS